MSNLKPVELDTFDAINNHWKCSACYMDGTTDNGGDCVCINDCNTLRPVYNDEPKKQTIPTYIWVIMGVLGAAMLAIVIGLTAAAALQANNASTTPRSIIEQPGDSFALDNNWNIYRSVGPPSPSFYQNQAGLPAQLPSGVKGLGGLPLTPTSTFQQVYGNWPTYLWDPWPAQPKGAQGPLFPTRQSALRIEIQWGAFTARSGGAQGVVKVRMVVPAHWFTAPSPGKRIVPYYTAQCNVGGVVLDSATMAKGDPRIVDYTFGPANPFIWPNGTNNQYPFDSYVGQMNIGCQWFQVVPKSNPNPLNGDLNFWVAVDPYNTGIWQNRFQARRPKISLQSTVNLINLGSATAVPNPIGGITPAVSKLNAQAQFFFKIPLLSVSTKSGILFANLGGGGTYQKAGEIVPDAVMAGQYPGPGVGGSGTKIVPNVCTYAKDTVDNNGNLDGRGWYLSNLPSGCVCPQFDVNTRIPAPTYCKVAPVAFIFLFKSALGLAMGLPASPATDPNPTVIDVFFGEGPAGRRLQDEAEPWEEQRNDQGQRKMQDSTGGAAATVSVGQPAVILTVAIQAGGSFDPVTGNGINGFTTAELQQLAYTAMVTGAVTKLVTQLTEYGDDVKAAFASPALGAPTLTDIPWQDNSGVFSALGYGLQGVVQQKSTCTPATTCTYLDATTFSNLFVAFPAPTAANAYKAGDYLPATDDGNSGVGALVYPDAATDDGGAVGSFRKVRKLASGSHDARKLESMFHDAYSTVKNHRAEVPFDHAGEEVPLLDTHAYDVKKTRRALKGIILGTNAVFPSSFPTPTPVAGYQPILEFTQVRIPFALQIVTSRAPIHQVFAMFLMCAMWMIVLGQLLAFLPYYLRIQKVNSAGMASGQAPLIFALTGIRRAMPQSPEIGAIFDFASYYWCLIIVTFNMIFMGVNWNLFALNRPAREKAYAANEKEAKLLANKGFAKLSTEEVVNLFINTKRADWVPALQANKTTGKALKYVTKIEEMAEIVPGGPDWKAKGLPKFELIADIKSWAADGVDRAKLLPPAGGIPVAALPPPVKAQPGDKIPAPGVPLSPLGSPPAAKAAAAPKKK